MGSISYELAAGFPLLFGPALLLWRWGPEFLPWVLIVQAESNFIDCMCMRHDHIETVLHGERQRDREDVVRKPA